MNSVHLELPAELVEFFPASDQPVERTALELIVLELYRRRTISSGRAAELLGMPRFEFVQCASNLGIPFFELTEEEWAKERRAIETMLARRSSSAIPAR